MSIDLSKIGYGTVFSPVPSPGGVVVSKISYGVVLDPVTNGLGVVVSKIGYGVIFTEAVANTRRRGFMSFHP